MAFIPSSGSVVTFQSDATKLTGTMSVQGTLSVLGTVPVTQVTTPWTVQNTSGSIVTLSQGSVGAVIIGGSVAVATGNSSVMLTPGVNTIGSVAALQGTNPWIMQNTSGSIFAYQAPGSILAVSATVNTGNSSVQLLGGNNAIGSVTALQGTNPWTMQPTSGSVFAYQSPGSILAVSATVNTGNSSVQVLGGTATIGSVVVVGNSTNAGVTDGTTQRVIQATGSSFNTSIVGVGTGVTSIIGANANRIKITFINTGTNVVYLGAAGNVNSVNGVYMAGIAGYPIIVRSTASIFGVATASQNISYIEEVK